MPTATAAYTLKEIAAAIAKADRHGQHEKVHNQLRNLTNKKLLKTFDNLGPKAAGRYDLKEAAFARFLLSLQAIGLNADALLALHGELRAESRSSGATLSFDQAFRSSTLPDDDTIWQAEVFHLWKFDDGTLIHGNHWIKNGKRIGRPDPLSPDSVFMAGTIESATFIPVTAILDRFFAALISAD